MVLLLFCDNATNVMSKRFLENLFIFAQKKQKHNQNPFFKQSADICLFIDAQFGLRHFHFERFLKGILCGLQLLKCRNSNGLEFIKLINLSK